MKLLIILSVFFSQLTMRDGLSQNTVFSINQDAHRNMWFATYDGVTRFDGYSFSVFRTERDPDYVQQTGDDPIVFTDQNGRLWVFDGGLNRFDEESESFLPYRGFLRGSISAIANAPDDNLFIVTGNEVVELDPESGKTTVGLFKSNIHCIDTGLGILVLGTNDGRVLIYRMSDYSFVDELQVGKPDSKIRRIKIRTSSEVWVLLDGSEGVVCLDLGTRSLKRYQVQSSDIALGNDSQIYLGTSDSILKYDPTTGNFIDYSNEDDKLSAVMSIFADKDGGLWCGTFRSGVLYSYDSNSPVQKLELKSRHKDLYICSIFQGYNGKPWISTNDGVLEYDTVSKTTARVDIADGTLDNGVMVSLVDEKRHKMYFGNASGIISYDYRSHLYTSLSSYGNEALHVYSLVWEDDELIWVGTLTGIYQYNTVTNSLQKVSGTDHLFTYKLMRDGLGYLWAATASGLFRAKLTRNQSDGNHVLSCSDFERCSPATETHDIIQSGSNIYVAARNGLFVMDSEGVWAGYDPSDGLSNSFLNGLEEDGLGRIWIGSEDGLNMFDPKSETFTRYYIEDGIGVGYFTKNAHYALPDGKLYFGGVGGVCCIDPNLNLPKLYCGVPSITGARVNGSRIKLTGNTLVLKHSDNSISFSYTVRNYSSLRKSMFYYMLDGEDKQWNSTMLPYSTTYSSLRPGKYRFRLTAANKNQVLSDQEAHIDVIIKAPWYSSMVAMILYVLLFCGGIAYFLVWISRKNKRKLEKAVAQTEEKAREEIDKLRVQNLIGKTLPPDGVKLFAGMLNIIEDNISNPAFGVEMLASEMCMSRSNLFLKIKEYTDDSASRLIRVVRFNMACRLLAETDKTIEEIASETGYSSGASFSASFKKENGVSPMEWRRR